MSTFIVPAISLLLLMQHQAVHGFVPFPPPQRFTTTTTTTLFYTDDDSSTSSRKHNVERVLTIPVLSPIPGRPPLLVGEDFLLQQPTPMQWKVLEEAMFHHHHQQQSRQDATTTSTAASVVAGIDAAPLVAFMDHVTSQYPLDPKNSKYATIAAVVGISSSTNNNNKHNHKLDTSSNTDFMESIMNVFRPEDDNTHTTVVRPHQSTVRLVGIGRAALSDFHSRLPSSYLQEQHDDEGYIILPQDKNNNHRGDDTDDDDDHDDKTPILMARFRLLTDGGQRSARFLRQHYYERSQHASPVHAVNEMNSLAIRITALHEDRKRLVRGLQAAKARLAVVSSLNKNNNNDLQDHDGLGFLSSGYHVEWETKESDHRHSENKDDASSSQQQQDIEALLHDFPTAQQQQSLQPNSFLTTGTTENTSLDQLSALENYGMGISSASFLAIPSLTHALTEKLEPFYSPTTQQSEEHYYELFSFMGVLSLNKFVAAHDMDWALKCTNTIERLQWVYEWMWSHKRLLQQASEQASAQLRDCGEECTDLW